MSGRSADGTGRDDHPIDVMQRVTDRTLDLIDPARGVMVGVVDRGGVTYVAGAGNQANLVGTHVGLDTSLSGRAISSGDVLHSPDTEDDPRVDLEACRRHSVRSLVCVPLERRGDTIGVLAVNAPTPGAFTAAHVDRLTRLGGFISVAIASALDLAQVRAELVELEGGGEELSADAMAAAELYVARVLDPHAADRLERSQVVQQVLDDPALLSTVFQPVVDLQTEEVIAVEALSRFAPLPYRTPDLWFADAHRSGLGEALELLAIERALARLSQLGGMTLAVNVGPAVVRAEGFLSALADVPLDRVILELTEHDLVDDYPALIGALRPLRRNGLRVAIDDTGAGYSSLAHILKVAPDFIKLDFELTSGIDMDPVRRALAASLVSFAADTGAEIIAEGVETQDELDVLRRLGVRYGQGFHIGRPGTVEAMVALEQIPPT